MTDMTGGSNGTNEGRPVFLTVHNENGEGNPWSVLLIEALQKYGCTAVVVSSLAEGQATVVKLAGVMIIPLFDLKFGLNRWSPCLKTASGVPGWARELSTGSCIAIGERCVAFPSIIEGSARQIARMFSPGESSSEEFPWGRGPLPVSRLQQKRRRAWRAPQNQWRNLFWRGNGK